MKTNAWVRYSVFEKHPNSRIQSRNKILRALGIHKFAKQAHKYLERLLTKYSVDNSELWCNYGNWQGKLEYAPKWHYGNGIFGEFEGLKVRIPENFDAYLTQKYGDWRSDPPLEKQQSHHDCLICDTEHSFLQYLSNTSNKIS
jgi:lipopolysaccharide cholinephosphotransferase